MENAANLAATPSFETSAKGDAAELDILSLLSPEERQALLDFKGRLQQEPEYADHLLEPDLKLLRFLRARSNNVDKAIQMIAFDRQWRAQWHPEAITQDSEGVRTFLESGCWRCLGLSRNTHRSPILWCIVELWNPHEYTLDTYVRSIHYLFENVVGKICSERDVSTPEALRPNVIALIDLRGWKLWHANYVTYVRHLIGVLQSHYPEELKQLYLLNAPIIFRAFWRVIKALLDVRTREKIVFVSGEEGERMLKEEIDGGDGSGANVISAAWDAERWAEAMQGYSLHCPVLPGRYGGSASVTERSVPVPNLPGERNVNTAESKTAPPGPMVQQVDTGSVPLSSGDFATPRGQ